MNSENQASQRRRERERTVRGVTAWFVCLCGLWWRWCREYDLNDIFVCFRISFFRLFPFGVSFFSLQHSHNRHIQMLVAMVNSPKCVCYCHLFLAFCPIYMRLPRNITASESDTRQKDNLKDLQKISLLEHNKTEHTQLDSLLHSYHQKKVRHAVMSFMCFYNSQQALEGNRHQRINSNLK